MVFAGLGIALMLAAWVAASRPFAPPDEAAHYLRALGIANGQLVGPRVPLPPDPVTPPAQQAWAQQDTRGVVASARMSPPGLPCVNGRANVSGSCLDATYTGDYHPLPYLLPALALTLSHDESTGLWLARAASALPCLVFILLAIALLWDGSVLSLLGLFAALAPTTLFVASVLNPDGVQIASALAFTAAGLRIARCPSRSPAWVWSALVISGAVAVLSWQLGPGFVIVSLVLIAGTLDGHDRGELLRTHGKALRILAATLVSALAAYLAYGFGSGLFHSSFSPFPIVQSLRLGTDQLRLVARESVAVFGPEKVFLPSGSYWVWWLLVVALLAGAISYGKRRDRVVVSVAVLIAIAFPVVFYAGFQRQTGFGLQGRYVVPVLMLMPLLAGELLTRRRRQLPAWLVRWAPVVLVDVVAVFQLFAWDVAARAAAGEPRAIWFLTHPVWSPPGGWSVWTTLSVLGQRRSLSPPADLSP